MSLRLLLPVFLLFLTTALTAQFSSIEIYGGIGVSNVPSSFSSSTYEGLYSIGGGEDFILRQMGRGTTFTETSIEPNWNSRVGVEGHLAVGKLGSLYFGLNISAQSFTPREEVFDSEFESFGRIDTMFLEPSGGSSGGTPIQFCSENNSFLNFTANDARGFLLDIGLPIGYRHYLLNGRLAVRAQISINTPILVTMRRETSTFEVLPSGCLDINRANADLRDAHDVSQILLRAGGGFDVRIGHSFSLGLLVEQQLNDYFTTTQGFIIDGNASAQVPTVTTFRPLTAQLVGRYRLR